MSMIFVEFWLDHPILHETVQAVPGITVEWERNVPTEDGAELLVWIDGAGRSAIEDAMASDPTIERVVDVVDVNDRWLYTLELADAGMETDLYPILLETGSLVRQALVTTDGWDCKFGFAGNAALSRFFDTCRAEDIGFEIKRIYEPREQSDGSVLTGLQRDALDTAMETGYFDIPRSGDLQEVGHRLGISDSAASERIRRGLQTLIRREIR